MTLLSGWCMAAPGARVPHGHCRDITCTCTCHQQRDINGDPIVFWLNPDNRPPWRPREGELIKIHQPHADPIPVRVVDLHWTNDHECTFRLEPITETA